MRKEWKRISVALTEKEINTLKLVKNYYKLNNREILMGAVNVVCEEIPDEYKESLEDEESQKEKIKDRLLKRKKNKAKG